MDEATGQTLAQVAKALQPQADEYCLLWINWWATCLTKSEWASWVQAIGSVAAIYFAGLFARRQWRQLVQREDARDKAQEWQRMTVLIELADYAVALLELVPDPANEQIGKQEMLDYFKQYRHWAFEETADSLKRFGPEHVPDGRALIHTLEIVRCLGDMKHPLETVHSFANGSEPRKQAIWRNDDLLHKVAGVQTRAKAASAALHEIRSTYARVHLDRNDVT